MLGENLPRHILVHVIDHAVAKHPQEQCERKQLRIVKMDYITVQPADCLHCPPRTRYEAAGAPATCSPEVCDLYAIDLGIAQRVRHQEMHCARPVPRQRSALLDEDVHIGARVDGGQVNLDAHSDTTRIALSFAWRVDIVRLSMAAAVT